MSSSEQWRWTDEEGVQRLLRGDELRAALADGRLRPDTLVWKRGMSNWRPAKEVPELLDIDLDDEDETATITERKPLTLGQKSAPTPSIPPTPGNMVDISSLHAQQQGSRPLVPTLMGVGGKKKATLSGNPNVRIPIAPKMPRIDGGWRDGAARRDDDEETVTRVRPEDEELSTVSDRKQIGKKGRTKNYGAKSVAPPRKRNRQTQPTGSLPGINEVNRAGERRGIRPGRGALPGAASKRVQAKHKSVPPPVKSSAVLSEAFPSNKGLVEPQPSNTLVSGDDIASRIQPPNKAAPKPPARRSAPPPKPMRSTPPPAPTRSKGPPVNPNRSAAPQPRQPASEALPLAAKLGDAKTKPDSRGIATSAPPLTDSIKARPSKKAPSTKPRMPTGPLPAVRPNANDGRPEPDFSKEVWAKNPKNPAERLDTPSGAVAVAQQPQGSLVGSVVGAPKVEVPEGPGLGSVFTRNAAMAAAGIAIGLVVASFFLGRLSAPAEAGMAKVVARRGMLTVPLFARTRAVNAQPRPCLMKRAPGRFAPAASKSIPIELADARGKLAVGYAQSLNESRGMLVDLDLGTSEEVHAPEEPEESDVSRVVPSISDGEVTFATTLADAGGVRAAVSVGSSSPFIVGFTADNLVRQPEPDAEPAPLWPLDPPGKRPDALQARPTSTAGTAIAYRYDGQIFYGALSAEGTVAHAAQAVEGSGGKVGKPSVATDGREVSVVFADKPPVDGARIELRWAHGPLGEPLTTAAVVEIPAGGPGGDAIAPAIASLPGRRWLLMWTEGKRPGPYTLRAQTYDAKYRPIGEALRVSPGTGSFGQGTVGAVGEDAAVLFLLATRQGYEIWGTVLQCR